MNRLQIDFNRMSGLCGLALLVVLFAGCDRTTEDGTGPAGGASGEPGSPNAKVADSAASDEEPVGAEDEGKAVLPEPDFIPIDRLVITGATVLSGFQQNSDGVWSASALEDTTVVIEGGEVVRLVASSSFNIGLGDVAVTGRGRYVIAAPIVLGARSTGAEASGWLEGGRLVDAALSGIGGVVLPESDVDGPAGRCVMDRIVNFEIPAAVPIGIDGEGLDAIDDGILIGTDSLPGEALEQKIRSQLDAGMEPIEIIANLTEGVAAAAVRPDLGRGEGGSKSRLLILNDDPTIDPTAIVRPHAMTFGDRVMRRAEIEVLRDASARGRDMRAKILELAPEGADGDETRRWYTSTQAQVFAGVAAAGSEGDLRFSGRTGQPRFDRVDGRVRLDPSEGEPNLDMVYDGPPQSFEIKTAPIESGLAVELIIEQGEAINADSPGPTSAPIIDLAIDVDLRRALFQAGEEVDLELQELVYGNGPIGLAPRRYRFTPIEANACPPCFEGFEQVWRLEIFDLERDTDVAAATAFIGFREGRPARAKFDAGADAVWFDEYPSKGRPSVD